jgi:hypothetical protein
MIKSFWQYQLEALAPVCVGERQKKGTWRPCVLTIPYSAISGALREALGIDRDLDDEGKYPTTKFLHAAGFWTTPNVERYIHRFTFAPRERELDTARLPITVEYLDKGIQGAVFILINDHTAHLGDKIPVQVSLGAFKSKGFGHCALTARKRIDVDLEKDRVAGALKTRIPVDCLEYFGIPKQPAGWLRYGYLLEAISPTDGVFKPAWFEPSRVTAPAFLVTKGDANAN